MIPDRWMDHQWGAWDWRTIGGWDWMAIQLASGTLHGTLRGQPITGLTYTELVGYGPKSKLGL
jgi:hypothetical protein